LQRTLQATYVLSIRCFIGRSPLALFSNPIAAGQIKLVLFAVASTFFPANVEKKNGLLHACFEGRCNPLLVSLLGGKDSHRWDRGDLAPYRSLPLLCDRNRFLFIVACASFRPSNDSCQSKLFLLIPIYVAAFSSLAFAQRK